MKIFALKIIGFTLATICILFALLNLVVGIYGWITREFFPSLIINLLFFPMFLGMGVITWLETKDI